MMALEDEYKNLNPKEYEHMASETQARVEKYQQALKNDKGLSEKWYEKSFQPSGWKKMTLPREWAETELRESDGLSGSGKKLTFRLALRCIRLFWD